MGSTDLLIIFIICVGLVALAFFIARRAAKAWATKEELRRSQKYCLWCGDELIARTDVIYDSHTGKPDIHIVSLTCLRCDRVQHNWAYREEK